ncbi:MAG: hypothetical protein V7740_13865 [Pseudomonas marincola]
MKTNLGMLAILGVISFAGANNAIADDGDLKPFTTDELKMFLSDKSYPTGGTTLKNGKGAFYFHGNGTLDAIWKGTKETTKWTVEDKSKFCYTLEMFGPKECIQLMKNTKDGGYVQIYGSKKRNLAADSIVSGKQF